MPSDREPSTPPSVTFRAPERDEFVRIKELHYAGLIETGSLSNDRNLDADLDDLANTYWAERSCFYVAVANDAVIATGAIRPAPQTTDAGEIKRMRVETRYRGKGIGAAMLDRLIADGRNFGYRRLVLDVSLRQRAAQHLYEGRGFVETRRGDLGGVASIFYTLDL